MSADDYLVEQFGSARITRLRPVAAATPVRDVSMRQAKLALLAAGQLEAVEAAIQGLPEPERSRALIEWSSTARVERTHPTVALIAAATGWTPAQLDALFSQAAAIE